MSERLQCLEYRCPRSCDCVADVVEKQRAEIARLRDALDKIDHELGRPERLGLPAPIVNASMIAREALAAMGENDSNV